MNLSISKQSTYKSKLFVVGFAVVLASALIAATSATAFATNSFSSALATNDVALSNSKVVATDASTSDYAPNQSNTAQDSANQIYPTSFSLTNFNGKNCVTPARFQNPWGSCWAFGIMSAVESSILAESQYATKDNLDLSERHLAWFIKSHLPVEGEEGYSPNKTLGQDGEGFWYATPEQYRNRMASGYAFYGTVAFASGQGAVTEYTYDNDGNMIPFAPYKNDEGLLYARNKYRQYKLFRDTPEASSVEQAKAEGYDQFAYYSNDADATWALSENKRFAQSYKLQSSNIMPSVTPKSDGSLNTAGINAFKKELTAGRGLTIGYFADQSNPGRYINVKDNIYNAFAWENPGADHSVAIFGWDDNYDKDNFKITNPAILDSEHISVRRLKSTGEYLKNNSGTGLPKDPVTGEDITDSTKYEPALQFGDVKTITGDKIVYKKIGNNSADLSYSDDGTKLKDGTTEVDVDKTMMVALDENNKAKRDNNNHVIYRKWTPKDDKKTEEYENDENGNPKVDGTAIPLADIFVVEYARQDNVKVPAGNGAWLVKNSWGADTNEIPNRCNWGNNGEGWFYLSYYDMSLCMAETFDFAVTETERSEIDSYGVYQYDYMPASEIKGQYLPEETIAANVFPVAQDVVLKNVSTNVYKPNSTVEYQIYKLNDGYTNPMDGTLVGTASATYEFAGYHRATLDTPVTFNKGDVFSVVATQYFIDDNGTKQYALCFSASEGKNAPGAQSKGWCKGVVNKGESYVYSEKEQNGSWEDWAESLAKSPAVVSEQMAADNIPIKAYVEFVGDNPQPGPGDQDTDTAATGDNNLAIAALALLFGCISCGCLTISRKRSTLK